MDTLARVTWAGRAEGQDGVITRAQLRADGLSEDAIDRLARSGALVRRAAGVFLVRGAPGTYRANLWIAVLATDGVLAFATAAHLWGVTDELAVPIDVAVGSTRRVSAPPGVRVRRVFVPRTAVQRRDGLAVTSRRWTVLDCLGQLPRTEGYRLADRALQRGWLTAAEIEGRLAGFPGRAGNGVLRDVLRHCGDGAAAESERVLHRLLRSAGITGWIPNHPLWANGELVAVVDVALPQHRLAIEIDGWAYHSDVDRFQRDRTRQNVLVTLGWRVLRFTWSDLTQRPGYVIAMIRGHLQRVG